MGRSRLPALSTLLALAAVLLLIPPLLADAGSGGRGSSAEPCRKGTHRADPPGSRHSLKVAQRERQRRAQRAVDAMARSLPAPRASGDHRPNVLVLETDDMRFDDLRWMPTVRRLIQGTGLTFANSFAPYPLCCPSRVSFLNGQFAHNHGVLDVSSPFGFEAFHDRRSIATALQGSGYLTGLVGKYLNGYGGQPPRDGAVTSTFYIPPGWTRWHAAVDKVELPPWGTDVPGSTYDYYQMGQNNNGTPHVWTGVYSTDVLATQAERVLTGFARTGKPWFLWFTPIAPHTGTPREPDDPRTMRNRRGQEEQLLTPARPRRVRGRFDREISHAMGLPPRHPAERNVSDKPLWVRQLPEPTTQESRGVRTISRQRAESLYALDQRIRRLLQRLRATGQYDDTVVVFTSDNGYYLGEHRKRQRKDTVHEPSLRVPLLITGPGVPHGVRFDPVMTVDLAPTIAALGRASGLPRVDGKSLLPLIRRGDRGWDRAVVTEGLMRHRYYVDRVGTPGFPDMLNTRGIRLGRWKLTAYATGELELYDLARDPLENRNLADDPRYARRLHAMVRLWRRYESCAGASCRRPVPEALRLTADQERRLTRRQLRATREWYSDPGLVGDPLAR